MPSSKKQKVIPDSIQKKLDAIKSTRDLKSVNTNLAPISHDLSFNTVTRSNSLSRSYYKFSLNEKRLMEALISKINPMRSDNPDRIEISAAEFSKTFSLDRSNVYGHLSDAADSLLHKVITVRADLKDYSHTGYTLMSYVRYYPKNGYIECQFNPHLLPHLVLLRGNFSSYSLSNAKDFRSVYTWRFYELLVSWSTGTKFLKGRIERFSIEDLRLTLGVPESYRFAMFRKTCIDKAIDELRVKASIYVDIKFHKKSRSYTTCNIVFFEDEQMDLPL